MDRNEMTAEQKVKARWPDAFAVREGGYYWIDDGVNGSINGTSSSEEAAWINAATHAAASRIESKPDAGTSEPETYSYEEVFGHPQPGVAPSSAAPAESKPQTESALEPGWKAEADQLAEALRQAAERLEQVLEFRNTGFLPACDGALAYAQYALASYAAKGGGL